MVVPAAGTGSGIRGGRKEGHLPRILYTKTKETN